MISFLTHHRRCASPEGYLQPHKGPSKHEIKRLRTAIDRVVSMHSPSITSQELHDRVYWHLTTNRPVINVCPIPQFSQQEIQALSSQRKTPQYLLINLTEDSKIARTYQEVYRLLKQHAHITRIPKRPIGVRLLEHQPSDTDKVSQNDRWHIDSLGTQSASYDKFILNSHGYALLWVCTDPDGPKTHIIKGPLLLPIVRQSNEPGTDNQSINYTALVLDIYIEMSLEEGTMQEQSLDANTAHLMPDDMLHRGPRPGEYKPAYRCLFHVTA